MIQVVVFNAHPRYRVRRERVRRWVGHVAGSEGIQKANVGVVFTTSHLSRSLHRRYFGEDRATDVMAFPLGKGETIEGEIYVNVDRARVQSREYGVPLMEELTRLVVHGALHLAGYDDRFPGRARRMRRRESVAVRLLCSDKRRV